MRDYFKMAPHVGFCCKNLKIRDVLFRGSMFFEKEKTLWITWVISIIIPPDSLLFAFVLELSNFDKRTPLFCSNRESHCL